MPTITTFSVCARDLIRSFLVALLALGFFMLGCHTLAYAAVLMACFLSWLGLLELPPGWFRFGLVSLAVVARVGVLASVGSLMYGVYPGLAGAADWLVPALVAATLVAETLLWGLLLTNRRAFPPVCGRRLA